MPRSPRQIFSRVARTGWFQFRWRLPDVTVTWLQADVEWMLLFLGGTK